MPYCCTHATYTKFSYYMHTQVWIWGCFVLLQHSAFATTPHHHLVTDGFHFFTTHTCMPHCFLTLLLLHCSLLYLVQVPTNTLWFFTCHLSCTVPPHHHLHTSGLLPHLSSYTITPGLQFSACTTCLPRFYCVLCLPLPPPAFCTATICFCSPPARLPHTLVLA